MNGMAVADAAVIFFIRKRTGFMEKTILEERKKTIYQFICDEFYVPMKAKEMAVVLSVPKSQRSELQEYLTRL